MNNSNTESCLVIDQGNLMKVQIVEIKSNFKLESCLSSIKKYEHALISE